MELFWSYLLSIPCYFSDVDADHGPEPSSSLDFRGFPSPPQEAPKDPETSSSPDFHGFTAPPHTSMVIPMEVAHQSQDTSALDFDTTLFSVVIRSENDSPPQRGVKKIKERQAYDYQPNVSYEDHTALGTMSVVCDFCNALRWKGERAGMCCLQGKINIPVLGEPPEPLRCLLLGEHLPLSF